MGSFLQIVTTILTALSISLLTWIFMWARKRWLHTRAARKIIADFQLEIEKQRTADMLHLKDLMEKCVFQLWPNHDTSLNDMMRIGFKNVILGQQNILEIIDVATWKSDRDGRFVYVSINLCELIGATQIELLDYSWLGIIVFEDRERVRKEWFDSIKNASQFDTIFTCKKADGNLQKVRAWAIHTKGNNAKVEETLGRLVAIGQSFKV